MKIILFAIIAFFSQFAGAAILNWDSRIPLTEGRVEYVTDVVTQLEVEWKDQAQECKLEDSSGYELVDVLWDNDGDQQVTGILRNFTVSSVATVGGPTCPGQEFYCETTFVYKGPQDWEVSASCEDPN